MRTTISHAPVLAAITTFTAVLATAAPRVAHADDDREALLMELYRFTAALAEARAEGARAASQFERPAAECDAVVAKLARSGMKPDDLIDDDPPYPFRRAPDRCRSYAQWKTLLEAAVVVEETAGDLATAQSIEVGWGSEEHATTYAARAAACTAAIDRAVAAGAPPTLTARIRSNLGDEGMTLAVARTEICGKLADWAKAFGPATIAAKKAAAEKARTRYASVGADGDRLSWLVHYDPDGRGAVWFVPGCKSVDDPKKLAKAPVLIRWTEADDGTQTLRRLQFKGNKLVKDTTRSFRTEGAARAGCK